VNHIVARRRLGPSYTTQSNVVFFRDPVRRAREAQARRIAELLGPDGLVFLHDLLAAS
jgi:hypothetical protein